MAVLTKPQIARVTLQELLNDHRVVFDDTHASRSDTLALGAELGKLTGTEFYAAVDPSKPFKLKVERYSSPRSDVVLPEIFPSAPVTELKFVYNHFIFHQLTAGARGLFVYLPRGFTFFNSPTRLGDDESVFPEEKSSWPDAIRPRILGINFELKYADGSLIKNPSTEEEENRFDFPARTVAVVKYEIKSPQP